ncbi:NAD-dependent malic enzyme [Saprospiraceae bacterium]|nr:NAD-dependent malic enzyme [Saprospiraceae bacterium]
MREKKGYELINDSAKNKSVAFTNEERQKLGLQGLLPHSVASQDVQVSRVMASIRRKDDDLERYILLSSLQDRNERLFYKVVLEHIQEIMPLIYTPTVGQACKEFSQIFRKTKGFYITPDHKGQIKNILDNWPHDDIRVIVVTDGQRILGLGDLGANGMGIPIGKLALYCACAGIQPHQCLPVLLDVGTNNEELLNDVLYLGYPHKRLGQGEYCGLVDEFVTAVQEKYPHALIQFEDFLTPNAYLLLNKYKEEVLCFNDDIQGTAAVALAGVYASTRISGIDFSDLKIMFLGAGSAATGIADLMTCAFMNAGLSHEEAIKRLWFVDIKGLVVSSRDDLLEHNLPYAHDHEALEFIEAIKSVKPHVLIGATGSPGTFTKEAIETMCSINARPTIFALSNPTSQAECTAEQAYTWSKGKAIFASGSPFDEVTIDGKTFKAGQGNNAYVFPGMGLGVITTQAKIIPDELFLVAAKALSECVKQEDINCGSLYPKLTEIRNLSLSIAVAVAERVFELGLAQIEKPDDIKAMIEDYMFDPSY